jgi:tetratricopeptide (TPR) repeat protein
MSGTTNGEERMACLSDLDVESFLAGELAAGDLNRVTRHLLAGCPECRSRLAAAEPPEPDEAYDACITRARRAVRRIEPRLRRDEERLASGVPLVREKGFKGLTWPEYRSLGVVHVEVLLQLSFEQRYSNPREMLRLARAARFALEEAGHPVRYSEALHFDRRAQVWGELANAWRVNEGFQEAEEALETARSFLEQGTGDPMLAARIDDLEASLRKAQRRLDEACRLLDRVHRAYMKIGERHLAGRALMKKGITLELQKRPAEALRSLRKAITLIDAERDPQLHAAAHHSILKTLVDSERYAEAGKLLLESDLRRKFSGDPLNLLRLRWVEAKILAGRGRLKDAETVLAEVRHGFLEHRLAYVAAVAGLDQAEVMLRQGKKVHELACDILARCEEHAVDPEAVQALVVYEVLCANGVATVRATRTVRDYVEQFQDNPGKRSAALRLLG